MKSIGLIVLAILCALGLCFPVTAADDEMIQVHEVPVPLAHPAFWVGVDQLEFMPIMELDYDCLGSSLMTGTYGGDTEYCQSITMEILGLYLPCTHRIVVQDSMVVLDYREISLKDHRLDQSTKQMVATIWMALVYDAEGGRLLIPPPDIPEWETVLEFRCTDGTIARLEWNNGHVKTYLFDSTIADRYTTLVGAS